MQINIENCLRNELPRRCDWLRNQLVTHLKELRDKCACPVPRVMAGAVSEFFDFYRFDDNQCLDDWRETQKDGER